MYCAVSKSEQYCFDQAPGKRRLLDTATMGCQRFSKMLCGTKNKESDKPASIQEKDLRILISLFWFEPLGLWSNLVMISGSGPLCRGSNIDARSGNASNVSEKVLAAPYSYFK
ncbi:hypothetical protein COV93_08335 [Candidatus Woesearchaeota archaeon CG11_big_fil_rev_8_21_14_0_20_43_8]|nr:MAG: hypothetical protein COV93_08335 [Candidatus Woesearchaeota archaeon CG11_big_fil_rev_8_21_14_0_20_43_8]PIO06769.1 MAG: hypothetical protein COT47_02805 [Candidatus Woesearchaeota archaeon CG08_land_8_20_14_0_20_43_7]